MTTPTVKAPNSFVILAIAGAAPVPVPPPIPAVINTISQPSNALTKTSRFSSTAWLPTSALAPAPKPFVSSLPIWSLIWELFSSRSWASVLTAINSTLSNPDNIILFKALPPAPPTPTTAILAFCSDKLLGSNNILTPFVFI